METKRCTKCGEVKELVEFYKGRNQCIVCRKEHKKEYCQQNKERIKVYRKEQYQKNKEYYKEYRNKNKECYKEYRKKYYQQNKEREKEYCQQNKERIKVYRKEWYEKNKESVKEYNQQNKERHYKYIIKRNAIKRSRRAISSRRGEFENVNPVKVFNRDKWTCKMCGIKTPKKLKGTYEYNAPVMDHIIPIAKGGMHTYSNVQCSCWKCNNKKGAKLINQLVLAI